MELTEFLLARIGEDESAAQAVLAEHPMQDWDAYRSSAGFYGGAADTFAGRFNPERVLVECEAKRQIVEEHADLNADWEPLFGDSPEDRPPSRCEQCVDHEDVGYQARWPCRTLRLLALPYADHPDYRPDWRP